MLYAPFKLRSVFHPTDFSPASEVAFAHALRLALDAKAELRIMHIDQATPQWNKFPHVRDTLVRWGLLPPGSAKTAVGTLGLRVEKVQHRGGDPVTSLLRHLDTSLPTSWYSPRTNAMVSHAGCMTPLPNPSPGNPGL